MCLQQVAPVAKKTTKPNVKRLIYVGPNIPGGILHKFTVFKGGIPKHIEPLIKKCSVIEKMFVPVKEFPEKSKAIEQKGTPENIFYRQIIEFVNKGGLK